MASFRLLRRARKDVLDIATFTADRWGEVQAERYLIALFDGFQSLVDRPDLRRAFQEIPPYFRALIGRHAIFYRVATTGEVVIVRILHAAMLPELHLREVDDA
jgi:toxin ParE1/3/4